MGAKFLSLFLAGDPEAQSRYHLSGLAHSLTDTGFPAGTCAVNILGCFLFGPAWTSFEDRPAPGPEIRIIVLTGVLGALTTFSTFAFETANLIRRPATAPYG